MVGTAFVSGGSGYIAGFLIRQLIDNGWTVHTSVRNLAREGEVRSWLDTDNSRLKFFQADLGSDAGWAEAMNGCTHVAHVASPFPLEVPKDPSDLIIPARDGALRALRFAKDAGVRRFVLTSSIAAIAYGHGKGSFMFTEKDWTNVESADVQPYPKSKTIAERAARDWIAQHGEGMEFASVNPAGVFGPVMGKDFSTSIELVRQLIDGKIPACPDIGFGIVDVRDVADLHYRAMTAPDIKDERFIASGPFMKMIDVAKILKAGLGDRARKVPTRKMPDWALRLLSLVRPELKQVVNELGNVRGGSSAHAETKLGWKMRSPEQTLIDAANSLIERGIVKL